MSSCTFNVPLLHLWFDGEAGQDSPDVQAHVESCHVCAEQVALLSHAQRELSARIKRAVGEVEPLLALRLIRERMARDAEASWLRRGLNSVRDAWLFNRRSAAAVGLAAAFAAAATPVWLVWVGRHSRAQARVVVESLQVDDQGRAVVQDGKEGATLIWLEPVAPPR